MKPFHNLSIDIILCTISLIFFSSNILLNYNFVQNFCKNEKEISFHYDIHIHIKIQLDL
jgi:hypothetical protein